MNLIIASLSLSLRSIQGCDGRTPEAHFVAVERRLRLENPFALVDVVVEEFNVLWIFAGKNTS